MTDYNELSMQLTELEERLDRYILRDAVRQYNADVEAFNEWIAQSQGRLEESAAELEREHEALDELRSDIEGLGEAFERERAKEGGSNAAEIESLRSANDGAVTEHNERVRAFEERQSTYNDLIAEHNAQSDRYSEELTRARGEADEYQTWHAGDAMARFSAVVGELYASICVEYRRAAGRTELSALIDRARRIRRVLGERAIRINQDQDNGLLIVEADLGESEPCWMIVDNAASTAAITPEMVDVLDIGEFVGSEVEISLPGAITIRAPSCILPKVTVEGHEAEFVTAVVLEESHPGIDGSIGLSFLNRFDFRIEKGNPQRLTLEKVDWAAGERLYDVFICHNSLDYACSKMVYDHLVESDYHPFLSEISLREAGTPEIHRSIEAALAQARHIVVVASEAGRIQSQWVEAEWRLFLHLKLSGKKDGNLLNVMCEEMTAGALPPMLGMHQAIATSDPDWKDALVSFLPR